MKIQNVFKLEKNMLLTRHLDNQLKEIEVEEKKVAKGSVAEKLDLRIIQSGTAIRNAHRTTLKDNDDDDHIAEK